MRTKFLVSVPMQASADGAWTTGENPVVPCFPPQGDSAFLCIGTWELARRAEVKEIDFDPDALAAALAAEYPGIPREMHDAYVMRTFEAAFTHDVGERFAVLVDQDTATLLYDAHPGTYKMWESKPGAS